jgi:eukaryotic-like serine/threonine-protein kinase
VTPLSESTALPHLAKYEILEELGHGGMATVYRAKDVRLGREVAVKIIHKHLRESHEMAARFEAEARAVAKLRHPNIVEVYDVSSEDEPDKYIVVELSRGATLRKLLAKVGEMPPEIAALLAIELGHALSCAHAAGVIHRDLKPENVLIETIDAVKVQLTDFGIAKILDAQGVTSTGQVLGSPAHMAPEQIEGGDVNARADVFGLGVLLYECMVGHLPFEGKNPAQVLRRVLEGSYAAADRERPSVGAKWAKMLAKALSKEASDRFPSADAFLRAMQAEVDSLGFSDSATELRMFFSHPEAYRQDHGQRLVAALTRRGEQARKAGDRHGAAADFNRALAYAPQDANLLRLIGRLQRGRATRRVLVVALAGSAVAGAAAFAMSRVPLVAPKPPAPTPVESGEARANVAPPARVETVPSATDTRSVVAQVKPPPASSRAHVEAPEPPAPREVKIVTTPKGAEVRIDDGPPEQLFNAKPKRLPAGKHHFRAMVRDSKCCEILERDEEINADDGSGAPQTVSLSLTYRDAEISAPQAPAGSILRCPLIPIAGPASKVFTVKMKVLEEDFSCDLEAPGVPTHKSSITLRAGERIDVPWSAP